MRAIDRLDTNRPFIGTRKVRRLVHINRKRARAADGAPGTHTSRSLEA